MEPDIVAWARAVQPGDLSAEARAAYIRQATTPGGVTEAILLEIDRGASLSSALEHGIERSRELAEP